MRRNTRLVVLSIMLLGLSAAMSTVSIPVQAADKLDRTVLPIAEPKRPRSRSSTLARRRPTAVRGQGAGWCAERAACHA